MIREDEVYKIGMLTKTHGVGGELNMTITDDVFDRVEADYLVCRMDGILVPFFIEEYRFRNDTTVLIKFEGIDNEAQARKMVGAEVYFPKKLADGGEEGTYSWHYFVGFEVVDETEGSVGHIKSVDDSTVNVLFEIESPMGDDVLVPASEELITDIDHQKKIIYMALPEGLLSMGSDEESID